MPSQPGQTDPLNVASIVYEDHAILSIRVQRLLEARALVLTPMPRTTHLVSNIEAQETENGEFTAAAAFICVEHQADKQKIYSGRHAYQLDAQGPFVPDQDEARGSAQQRRRAFGDVCAAVAPDFDRGPVQEKAGPAGDPRQRLRSVLGARLSRHHAAGCRGIRRRRRQQPVLLFSLQAPPALCRVRALVQGCLRAAREARARA